MRGESLLQLMQPRGVTERHPIVLEADKPYLWLLPDTPNTQAGRVAQIIEEAERRGLAGSAAP